MDRTFKMQMRWLTTQTHHPTPLCWLLIAMIFLDAHVVHDSTHAVLCVGTRALLIGCNACTRAIVDGRHILNLEWLSVIAQIIVIVSSWPAAREYAFGKKS